MIGTWVSIEIKKALELGYKLLKIEVIWQYEVVRYDPSLQSGGLFTEYINTFLKFKQEASGWPKDVKTENDKRQYIDNYKAMEGVTLEYANINKNPGMRSVAK